VVISVAISLLYPSLIALAARAAGDPLERAAAISTFTAFFEIGAAAGGAVLGPVADAGGYQTAYLVGAVTAAAGVVVYRALVLDRIAR
jgi:predicted MFS family arabinose efflux permease